MSSDTIRLIAEFFAACVGTIAFALLFQVPRKYYLYCGIAGACGWICYKLIIPYTTEPVSIFFCNRARHHSVAQLRGIQALPGDGLSDRRNLSAGAGKRHLLDRLLRGDKRSGAGRRKRVSDIQRCGGDRARHSPRLRIPAELVP